MVQAARGLLSAVTRVLLLADMIVVKQIISIKKKVISTLNRLESVSSFSEFAKLFGVYGSQMVELAHLTGDRQNDLKDERRRSQLSASRTILEKSTMLVLTSSKSYLRHIECVHSRQCRDLVYDQVRRALELVGLIVYDSGSTTATLNPTLILQLTKDEINFVKSLRQFEYALEMLNVSVTSSTKEQLEDLCNKAIDNSQDFTDSVYISIEQREKVLDYHKKLQEQLAEIITFITNNNEIGFTIKSDVLPLAIQTIQHIGHDFRKDLEQIAMLRASEFFRTHDETVLLNELKTFSLTSRFDFLQEAIDRFREQAEIAIELSKLLKHISSCDQLQVSSEYHDMLLQNLSNMIIASAQSVAVHPTSRVPKENLDVLCRFWEQEINDFSVLVKEIQDYIEGRGEKTVYLSLPRPGKHGTTSKTGFKPTKLDSEEQAKIAKAGLEMKLVTSEMDAEAEKWDEPQNEIAKRAKNMSSMAYSMYLFTRGEGTLRTTQDLFTQAYYFVEEGTRLSAIIHEFIHQLPSKSTRQDMLIQLERIPLMCHQLKLKLKSPVSGKSSTFAKVDTVICEARDLMNAVTRLCTNVFVYQAKYNIVNNRTMPSAKHHSRLPFATSRWYRTPSTERDDRMEMKSDRTIRSTSLQRPSTYLPAFDHI
ncbi:unnamed protein product [Adineta ricciae]|uniref:Alpha-catulin n=1 Tax=Adineta ricciae TaxID=249248 RepID=A0A815Q219_ADIRI|nr:unnamed protein product [Adineta ricciae]